MSKHRYALALAFAVSLSVLSSPSSLAADYDVYVASLNGTASHFSTWPVAPRQDLENQKIYGSVRMSDAPVAGSVIEAQVEGEWEPNATFRYQWVLDGRAVSTEREYEVPLGGFLKILRVDVFVDVPGFYSIQVEGDRVMIQEPSIILEGVSKVGSDLTIYGIGTLSSKVRIVYEWLRDGKIIPNALVEKYKVLPQDVGHKIGVTATLTERTVSSSTTLTINSDSSTISAGTMATKTPTLSGVVKVGSTLTAKTTSWASGAKITYQWMLDGKAIKGATKSTYKILTTQKGKRLSVVVTQSALGYTKASKTSLSVKIP